MPVESQIVRRESYFPPADVFVSHIVKPKMLRHTPHTAEADSSFDSLFAGVFASYDF